MGDVVALTASDGIVVHGRYGELATTWTATGVLLVTRELGGSLAVTPDGRRVVSTTSTDDAIVVWLPGDGTELVRVECSGHCVGRVTASENHIFALMDGCRVGAWSLASGLPMEGDGHAHSGVHIAATRRQLITVVDTHDDTHSMAVSSDGRWLAMTGRRGGIAVFYRTCDGLWRRWRRDCVPGAHVTITSDSLYLVVAHDGGARLLNLLTGDDLRVLLPPCACAHRHANKHIGIRV